MNAKKRYWKRLKLQAALVRVAERLAENVLEEIPPDPTTALLAWQVANNLLHHVVLPSGMDASELRGIDAPRIFQLQISRHKETAARYRRRKRRRNER